MATIKKTSSNYIIQTPRDVTSNITLDTDTVYITGNLTIAGDTFHANVTNSDIKDNIIVLNYGETGNGVSTLGSTAGFVIDRGTAPGGNVRLRWNETSKIWQVSGVTAGSPGDGTQYTTLATSSTGLTALFDDKAPVLGANLNVNGFTIYSNVAATSYITLQGALQLKSANVAPTAAIGSTVFYASDTGAGQAGVFVVNPASTNEELVTKRRAFGFSLLL